MYEQRKSAGNEGTLSRLSECCVQSENWDPVAGALRSVNHRPVLELLRQYFHF